MKTLRSLKIEEKKIDRAISKAKAEKTGSKTWDDWVDSNLLEPLNQSLDIVKDKISEK